MTFPADIIPNDWFEEHSGQSLVLDTQKVARLIEAARLCHHEMRHTVAPRDSFTDALDALDMALIGTKSGTGAAV